MPLLTKPTCPFAQQPCARSVDPETLTTSAKVSADARTEPPHHPPTRIKLPRIAQLCNARRSILRPFRPQVPTKEGSDGSLVSRPRDRWIGSNGGTPAPNQGAHENAAVGRRRRW